MFASNMILDTKQHRSTNRNKISRKKKKIKRLQVTVSHVMFPESSQINSFRVFSLPFVFYLISLHNSC